MPQLSLQSYPKSLAHRHTTVPSFLRPSHKTVPDLAASVKPGMWLRSGTESSMKTRPQLIESSCTGPTTYRSDMLVHYIVVLVTLVEQQFSCPAPKLAPDGTTTVRVEALCMIVLKHNTRQSNDILSRCLPAYCNVQLQLQSVEQYTTH